MQFLKGEQSGASSSRDEFLLRVPASATAFAAVPLPFLASRFLYLHAPAPKRPRSVQNSLLK